MNPMDAMNDANPEGPPRCGDLEGSPRCGDLVQVFGPPTWASIMIGTDDGVIRLPVVGIYLGTSRRRIVGADVRDVECCSLLTPNGVRTIDSIWIDTVRVVAQIDGGSVPCSAASAWCPYPDG